MNNLYLYDVTWWSHMLHLNLILAYTYEYFHEFNWTILSENMSLAPTLPSAFKYQIGRTLIYHDLNSIVVLIEKMSLGDCTCWILMSDWSTLMNIFTLSSIVSFQLRSWIYIWQDLNLAEGSWLKTSQGMKCDSLW